MFRTVLVLAPHTDDGELGCGGAISKWIEEGKRVHYAAFSTCAESVPAGFPRDILAHEVRAATRILGVKPAHLHIFDFRVRHFPAVRQAILEELIKLRKSLKPDLVVIPSLNDLHQDHHTIAEEGRRAFKAVSVLGYEEPWNTIRFDTECLVPLEKRHVDRKLKAILAYKSQKARHYSKKDFIHGLARIRGVQAGVAYAEAFEVVRWIVRS